MLNFLAQVWQGFKDIFLPMGKDARFRILGPGVRWTLHCLVLALILGGLYYLNNHSSISGFLKNRVKGAWAQPIWLVLLFLGMYFLILTGWWIWRLLIAEPEASSFPDLDAAWEEAVHTLALADIRLKAKPMFLVLGRPEAGEERLFQAAPMAWVVKQAPAAPQAPLHVYASAEAIFVTCPGASLLGKHAANVALEGIAEMAMGGGEDESPEAKTIRPSGEQQLVIKRLAKIAGRAMNVVERRATRRELRLPMPDLLKDNAEVERLLARLAHLGRLMNRERNPLCAINGVLVLAPLGGTDTELDGQQTAEICARDLAVLRRTTHLHCPLFVLGCDLEALPGFCDFIQRVPPRDRLGRLGQRFALAPDLEREPLVEQIDQSIFFMCNHYLRDWAYRLFRVEGPTTTNTSLYLFLDEMRARRKNFSRLLTHGIAKDAPLPLLYGGCYLAGTGADREREQAFVGGVVRRLIDSQNFVAWTDDALAEDSKCHRLAKLGYLGLAVLTLGILAAAGYFTFGMRGS